LKGGQTKGMQLSPQNGGRSQKENNPSKCKTRPPTRFRFVGKKRGRIRTTKGMEKAKAREGHGGMLERLQKKIGGKVSVESKKKRVHHCALKQRNKKQQKKKEFGKGLKKITTPGGGGRVSPTGGTLQPEQEGDQSGGIRGKKTIHSKPKKKAKQRQRKKKK